MSESGRSQKVGMAKIPQNQFDQFMNGDIDYRSLCKDALRAVLGREKVNKNVSQGAEGFRRFKQFAVKK
jgi:hypothetical protein